MEKLSQPPPLYPVCQTKDQPANQDVLMEAHEPMVNGPGEGVRDVSVGKGEATVARG